MATSKDVAKMAGVSVSSVSRAFREDVYINEETKNKIIQAANILGYTPNLMARSLKSQRSRIIGLIISDIENPFYSIITRILESELKRNGYRLLLSYSNENTEQEQDDLNLLSSSRVEGIIFTPASDKNQNLIKSLKKQQIALIQMYRIAYKDTDSVVVDDQKGAYLATKHLIQNGHRNIMLFSVQSPISPDRAKGYREAMKEEQIPIHENLIIHLPFQSDLQRVIMNYIQQHQPTAIVAGTNTIGMDVIKVAKELKLSIPDDISLVMFDDVPWASLLDITTVTQPIEKIGLCACKSVLDRIERSHSTQPISIVVEPHLISRNSVKNLYAVKYSL